MGHGWMRHEGYAWFAGSRGSSRREVTMSQRLHHACTAVGFVVALGWVGAALGQTTWVGQDSGLPAEARAWGDGRDQPTAPAATTAERRWLEWVPMPDGVLLATEIQIPATPGPFPTVLLRTPYPRAQWIGEVSRHVPRGYAAVIQECRGTGDSYGEFYLLRDDGPDGHATIQWIAQQGWSNGRVGMVGRSAMGLTQYAVAQGAPAALECLTPAHASPDWYHHRAYQGGSLRVELLAGWLGYLGHPNLLEEIKQHRLWDSWWEDFDWVGSPETIHVPMLHMGRWYDLAQQGTLDTFRILQHQGGAGAAGSQYLLMDPLDHFHQFGQLPVPPSQPDFETLRQQLTDAWLDYWLKDEPTGVAGWPQARVYLMGASGESGAPGNTWVEMRDWPPPAETRAFYLSQAGGGVLTESVPDPGQQLLPIDPLDPVPTHGGANLGPPLSTTPRGPWDQAAFPAGRPIESRSDVLTFTTEPLTQPVYVVGPVTARIWILPDTLDLDLSVRLTDVYPDGRSILIIDGIQRARMRIEDTAEHLLIPDVPTEIEVDLWSTAMVFNTGHRIRVAIAGSNWDRFEVNPNDGGDLNNPNYIPANPAILFGPEHPSAIYLPFSPLFADDFESGTTAAWSVVMP